MNTKKRIKKLFVFMASLGIFVFILSGCAAYYNPPAYSQGYFNIGVTSPNFAFSFGNGVNAYYAPGFGAYIYGYNGYYYRWLNGGWVYASVYSGPWYPVTAGIFLPGILAFGPPPPVIAYRPYFVWWRMHVGPWYRAYHPGWWARHQMFLRSYREWRFHAIRFYRNHPYQNWRMRRHFEHEGPRREGPGRRGPEREGPGFRHGHGPFFRHER